MNREARVLALPPKPPADLGPLLDAAEVARVVFSGKVGAQWVRRNVGHKRYLGRRAVWYQVEAERWAQQNLITSEGAA